MKCIYTRLCAAALLIFSFVPAKAQFNLGVATGNWSGTNSLYLNPANIADAREKFTIDIFSLNMGVDNNLGSLNTKGGIIGALTNGNTSNMFSYTSNDKFSLLAPYAKINGPGFMISINHKHSIAFTTSIQGMNQFNNFDKSLYQTIGDPNYISGGNLNVTSSNFNYTAHLWSQAGVSYGGVLLEKEHHELKVGVTLRYLGGIGYVGLKGNNLNVQYKSGADSFFAYNSDIHYASNVLNTTNAISSGFGNNSLLSQFFGAKTGSGLGGDIGFVYDYIRDNTADIYDMDGETGIRDRSKNNYLVRFSASVMDIGSILYRSSGNSNADVTGNGYLTGTGLQNNIGNYSDFRNYVLKQGFTADTAHVNTRVYMPTRLVLSGDYDVYKRWYVNATFIANVANRDHFGNSFYNQLTVTPRYDSRWLSVGLPVTYSMLSNSLKMGIGVRVSGFFFGSDDMLALVANHQYGFNFYMGGFIPFDKFRPRDRDGDHVSNRRDKCPDDYGTWENRGCPEKGSKEPEDDSADDTDQHPAKPATPPAQH